MPRHDDDHDLAITALIKDGWIITHDPISLDFGRRNLYIDLGAEELPLAAEREGRKIAVEIKSFRTASDMPEWERAIGQFILYRYLLKIQEPERVMYLAMRESAYERIVDDSRAVDFVHESAIRIIVIREKTEEIVKWIP